VGEAVRSRWVDGRRQPILRDDVRAGLARCVTSRAGRARHVAR
jgi:uncharacterized protein YbjT (DUF2867 family)